MIRNHFLVAVIIDLFRIFDTISQGLIIAKLVATGLDKKALFRLDLLLLKQTKALLWTTFHRNSRLEVFCKKRSLKNLAKLTGKHLCRSLFLNKVSCNFIKKETLTEVFFPYTFFPRTTPMAAFHPTVYLKIWSKWIAQGSSMGAIFINLSMNEFFHFAPYFNS